MRSVTHRRMFFSFFFMQVSSQERFHYETSLPPLFSEIPHFQFWLSKSLSIFRWFFNSPTTHLSPQSSLMIISFPYTAFFVVVQMLRLDDSSQIFTLLTAPYPHIPPQHLCSPSKPQQMTVPIQREHRNQQKELPPFPVTCNRLNVCVPQNAYLLLLFSPSVV